MESKIENHHNVNLTAFALIFIISVISSFQNIASQRVLAEHFEPTLFLALMPFLSMFIAASSLYALFATLKSRRKALKA